VPLVQSGTTKKVTVTNLRGSSVSAVTATAPVVSSGGTTPVISMAAATGSVNGYLTSTDWTTFNSKQPAGSYLVSGGALGTPSSGTATNLTGLPLSTGVTGTLPVANGGTGTATPSIVAGTNVTVTGTWPNQTINSTATGTGDVVGPASSTDNAVARFDSTTGKIIQNSGVVINDSGEVTVGVWKGTEIGLSYGGTGASTASQARGNILPSYAGNAGKVLAVNTGATDVEYISAGGTGTVTSVAVSGGTTGLTTSGGPITASGTITLGGTLAVASGGTGTATPSLVAGTNVTITGSWPNQTINATAGGSGTVTSVGGTGTVNGLTLTGTVTTSGNLTLGGTLDLSAPPAIGGTTPAAITGTTVTANTKFSGTNFDASGSGGGALRTSGGSNCLQWGGGGGVNLTLDGAFNMNPANATIQISPTGTGTLTVNPATAGTINNMAIGGTTPAAGAFTTLSATTAIGVASGGTGQTTAAAAITALTGTQTSGQYLRSNGTNAVLAAIQAGDVPTLNQNTSGTAAGLSATLAVTSGGTGQTSYTDGQLLIGNSTGNTLTKATLTAGTNVTITNAAGAITIAASGGGASAATPTALGTVYGKMDTSTLTFLGYQAGALNTGTRGTFVGTYAGYGNTSGVANIGVGYNSMGGNVSTLTGSYNIGIGESALQNNTSASNNVAIGREALSAITTTGNSTAVGTNAGKANTTGQVDAFGFGALQSNTLGAYNQAFGGNGQGYTAALQNNTSGQSNQAFGSAALTTNITGSYNVAMGVGALYSNSSSNYNTALGHQSGYSVTSQGNILLGYKAAYGTTPLTTGSNNIHIGTETNPSGATVGNEIVIGYNGSTGKGVNTGYINPNGGSMYNGANTTTWATTSDERLKKNIVNNNIGLEKLTQIQVRNFEYRLSNEITELPQNQAIKRQGIQLGVIAQELQAILPDCVNHESTGVLTVDADNLTWYMINAIKELKAEIDKLKGNV
jgi:hypothetical protein